MKKAACLDCQPRGQAGLPSHIIDFDLACCPRRLCILKSVRLVTHSCYFTTAALQRVIRFQLVDQQSSHFQTLHGSRKKMLCIPIWNGINSSLTLDVMAGQSDMNLSQAVCLVNTEAIRLSTSVRYCHYPTVKVKVKSLSRV